MRHDNSYSQLLCYFISKRTRTNLWIRHSSRRDNYFFGSIYTSRSCNDKSSIFGSSNRIYFMRKQKFRFIFFGCIDEKFHQLFSFSALEQNSSVFFYFGFYIMFGEIIDHIIRSKRMKKRR